MSGCVAIILLAPMRIHKDAKLSIPDDNSHSPAKLRFDKSSTSLSGLPPPPSVPANVAANCLIIQ